MSTPGVDDATGALVIHELLDEKLVNIETSKQIDICTCKIMCCLEALRDDPMMQVTMVEVLYEYSQLSTETERAGMLLKYDVTVDPQYPYAAYAFTPSSSSNTDRVLLCLKATAYILGISKSKRIHGLLIPPWQFKELQHQALISRILSAFGSFLNLPPIVDGMLGQPRQVLNWQSEPLVNLCRYANKTVPAMRDFIKHRALNPFTGDLIYAVFGAYPVSHVNPNPKYISLLSDLHGCHVHIPTTHRYLYSFLKGLAPSVSSP